MQEEITISNICSQRLFDEIHSLIKRPSLDTSVGKILSTYESQLEQSQIYLSNGIVTTNFAEAGLILQGCSEVYGKQVDMLYQKFMELNVALNLLRNDNDSNKAGTSGAEPNEPKQTDAVRTEPERTEPDRTNTNQAEATETQNAEKVNTRKRRIQNNEAETTNTTDSNEMPDETLWRFSIEQSPAHYLSRLKLPHWETRRFQIDNRTAENLSFPPHIKTEANVTDMYINQNLCVNGLCWNTLFVEENLKRDSESNDVDGHSDVEQAIIHVTKELKIVVERLTNDVIKKNTRSICVESVKEKVTVSEECPPKNVSPKKEVPSLCAEEMNLFQIPCRVLLKKIIFKLPAYIFEQNSGLKLPKKDIRKRKTNSEEYVVPLKKCKSYDLEQFENFCHDVFAAKGLLPPREPKLVEKTQPELMEKTQETSADESGHFTEDEMESDSQLQSCSNLDRTYRTESGYETDPQPSPRAKSRSEFSELSFTLEDTDPPDLESLIGTIIHDPKSLELYRTYMNPTNIDPAEADDDMYIWNKFISKKVNLEETHFDIHEYGTTILNSFVQEEEPSAERNISFQSLLEDKSVSEVAKLFVASLQLANTNNIEIYETKPGTLDPDNMHIKFLSSSRYHEEMDSFHAPSEDTFRERLERVRRHNITSTPVSAQVCRKRSNLNIVKRTGVKRRHVDYSS